MSNLLNLKIIFMGTPEFAVPSLVAINEKYGVKAVVTVPDKPKGRGLTMKGSPVKEKALELGIEVLQPAKLKDVDFLDKIREIEPDIIVVIAFRILPKELYSIPKLCSFNIHGSLLPKYRGAAPINWAIITGENQSGLTSFILQEKVDTGNLLLQYKMDLSDGMTAGELHDKLMPEAANLSLKTIDMILSENYTTFPQDDNMTSPAPKIFKEHCKINWQMESINVRNLINGLSPYPAAFTVIDGKQYKITKVRINYNLRVKVNQFIIKEGNLLIGTKDFPIEVLEIQAENKKAMPIRDFLNGWRGKQQGIVE